MNITINIGQVVGVFFVGSIAGVGILFLYLKNPEKFQRIAYHIWWFLSLIPIARKYLIYKKLGTQIESKLNLASKNIEVQAPGVLPHAMKIEWAKTGESVRTFLRNNDIVIRMGRDDDQESSIVISTLAYLEKDLLYDARHYVDPTLMQATDFTVAKSLLSNMDLNRAISYLMTNCVEPAIQKNPLLEKDCISLDSISDAGYLSRIFLPQMLFLKKKLWPKTTTGAIQQETRNFMEFVHNLSKDVGEDTPLPSLDYIQPRIKVKILLAARKDTELLGGRAQLLKRHVGRIKEAQSKGIEYLYICGWGNKNVNFIKSLARSQEIEGRLSILHTNEYIRQFDNRKVNSIVILTALNLNTNSEDILKPSDLAQIILEENIAELRNGQIEITGIGRDPGVLTMVSVRPLVENLDAVECILSQYFSGQLRTLFNEEKLLVFPWNDDPQIMISTALLKQNHRDKISSIELISSKKYAIVHIDDDDTRKIAVGKKGINVRVASELTGWNIDVRK
jgi:transcription antitermination factor NusA-like protein